MARTRNTKPERGIKIMTKEETQSETENVIQHNQAEIMAENLQLKAAVDALEQKLKEVTTNFDAAREQLEAETRSKKIARILMVADLGMDFLTDKGLAELDEIEELYKHAKKSVFRSTGSNSQYASVHDQALYNLNNMFKFGKKG